jgi:hypothetical protein
MQLKEIINMINDTEYILYDITSSLRAEVMYLTTPPDRASGGVLFFPSHV